MRFSDVSSSLAALQPIRDFTHLPVKSHLMQPAPFFKEKKPRKCSSCGETGHYKNRCPEAHIINHIPPSEIVPGRYVFASYKGER